jgi:proteasome lid subunit RPN8/RPN11
MGASAALAIGQVTIKLSERVTEEFKKKAKASFPNEAFAYLFGRIEAETIVVDDLFYPSNVDDHCHRYEVTVQDEWLTEAKKEARRTDKMIVGDIHSHPLKYKTSRNRPDTSPSESDWDGLVNGQIMAICLVSELSNGRLRARTKIWGPLPQVKVKQTK